MLQVALGALNKALAQPTLDGHAQPLFTKHRDAIAKYLRRTKHPEIDLEADTLDDTKKDGAYRRWCLGLRLFLNPLNDLGPHSIAARDSITTPDMTAPLDEGPIYQGLYNQLKQEFVSARFLCYEGVYASGPHFSDARVLLYNTLDYPVYSLAIEKVKASFRVAYSLLDKVAFFLNHYLKLGIDDSKVHFKSFWYVKQDRKLGLLPTVEQRSNWPLRGLFWIGKDLHDRYTPGFMDALEPDAQALADIRNHLEHKYLKLHEREWSGPPDRGDRTAKAMADTLAHSVYRSDFEAKTLRLLKMVRAALIYLALVIHGEEKERAKNRKPGSVIPGMPLDVWEDDWKR
jgi:hypothetical protein